MNLPITTVALLALLSAVPVDAQPAATWRYYRPGNTGIQGDFNECIWIAPDGDPWISGYDPIAEEGGIAKFVQEENRWLNVSNIDYPAFGSANDVGTSRVSDMVADGQGNLWLGSWRGLLRMNLAAGPASLFKFGPENSPLPGGRTVDLTLAPDGSIWVSATSVAWAGGGLTRYQPATNTWTHFDSRGGGPIAAQPKPGGGYYLWTSGEGSSGMDRWDSTTEGWTHIPYIIGNPVSLMSKDSVDDAGNMWVVRLADDQGQLTLDCLRPDGSWITPSLPPQTTQLAGPFAAIKPFASMQAYLIVIAPDLSYHLHLLAGGVWTDLGTVPHNAFIDDLEFAPDGTVWVCGSGQGGAIRRDPLTGAWQRFRVTNTSQFDLFNNDLTISKQTGDVYACANAGPGVGGMVRFDGLRWTGFNQLTYGLGEPWPFPSDNSESIFVRPSLGHLVVNPMNGFTHELQGSTWTSIPGGLDQVSQYAEDSSGRLWATAHYGGLGYFSNGVYTHVSGGDWFGIVQPDPDRSATVWANMGGELLRTDGAYRFSRTMSDFSELSLNGGGFSGLAVDHHGVSWTGTTGQADGTGSALIRLDAVAGTYQLWEQESGWPFPALRVIPQTVTPDGRLWMLYESETESGLLWWNGTNMATFPAPPNGEWRWGGMPQAIVLDLEVKILPTGYELWMSCASRGIAVLTITNSCIADFNSSGSVTVQDIFDFLNTYFAASPAADVNTSGSVTVQDIFDFLDAYFAACP